MKILFVTNNLYPNLNANSDIAYKLAEVIRNEYDAEVTILGYSDTIRSKDSISLTLKEHEMRYIGRTRYIMACHKSRLWKLVNLLTRPSCLAYFIRNNVLKKSIAYEYERTIKNLNKNEKYDAIVCFKNPKEALRGAINAKNKTPLVAYELDPWESNILNDEELKEEQYSYEKDSDAVVTTMILYDSYKGGKYPTENVYKAEFPNINKPQKDEENVFTDGKIHCVFAGQLYGDIRNPKFTIDLFDRLSDNGIVLDIFGKDNGCLKDVELPTNVVYHGEVPNLEATKYLNAADVVVNIGNTLLNQMPSKILTYIALGKPILNIMKSPECPTLEYMKKYSLSLNIEENMDNLERVREFCKTAKGKQIDFETIEKTFYTATPKYVGGQLYSIIENCIEEKALI